MLFVRTNEIYKTVRDLIYLFVVSVVIVGHKSLFVSQLCYDPRGAGQFRFGITNETRQDRKSDPS